MTQHRRRRGRETEMLVAKYFIDNGWLSAHVGSASASGSDIRGIPGLDVEVKARKNFSPSETVKQLENRSNETGMGVAVMRLLGQGEMSVPNFLCFLRFDDLVYLLKASGYGSTTTERHKDQEM